MDMGDLYLIDLLIYTKFFSLFLNFKYKYNECKTSVLIVFFIGRTSAHSMHIKAIVH